ncbi:histidine phosphatase family protein [Pseudoalteromonas sp. SG44-1]|uniref:histidine phosphatase family protein n=1 Tax=Pseudoalteromonas sp. SG44-1 TaxID=2760964 RepID=UPI0015FFE83E|nr:histidine phosphatase family protein [Pseudoalteromonas sp. SG44-1]MBB1419393.1 histidine phosphatase family protein [Pseudoalteromonas sp. SG44-1]
MPPFSSRVYLLRHGELIEQGVLAGHTDFLLSELGRAQLHQACNELTNIELVQSSTLKRCSEFARSFSHAQQIPLFLTDQLREFNFGDWDGCKYDDLWQQTDSPGLGDFWQSPWQVTPPHGESMRDFYQRIATWWQTLLIDIESNHTQAQLVLTHAGVIKQLLGIICQLPKESNQQNIFSIGYGKLICIDIYIDDSDKAWPRIVF